MMGLEQQMIRSLDRDIRVEQRLQAVEEQMQGMDERSTERFARVEQRLEPIERRLDLQPA